MTIQETVRNIYYFNSLSLTLNENLKCKQSNNSISSMFSCKPELTTKLMQLLFYAINILTIKTVRTETKDKSHKTTKNTPKQRFQTYLHLREQHSATTEVWY